MSQARISQWLDVPPAWIEARWVASIQTRFSKSTRQTPSSHKIPSITKWPQKTQRSYAQRSAHFRAKWPIRAKTQKNLLSMPVTRISLIWIIELTNSANRTITIKVVAKVKKRTLFKITRRNKRIIRARRRFLSKSQAFSWLITAIEFIMR